MLKKVLDVPESVKKKLNRNAKMGYVLFESTTELADHAEKSCFDNRSFKDTSNGANWYGGDTGKSAAAKTRNGDMEGVEASNAMMVKFEKYDLSTARPQWLPAMAGGRADVQAVLSGSPLTMRRRQPVDADIAPIAVIVDLSTSAMIPAEVIKRRGAAILALVRILSSKRPVELWVSSMTGADLGNGRDRDGGICLARLDTSPLDLARAAYILTSAGFPRRLCYSINEKEFNFGGGWAFGNAATERNAFKALLEPVFPHVVDMLAIPALHGHDEMASEPEKWVEKMLHTYAPHLVGDGTFSGEGEQNGE